MENKKQKIIKFLKNIHTNNSKEELEVLLDTFSIDYFELSDLDDLKQNLQYFDVMLGSKIKKINYESDIERIYLIKDDINLMKSLAKEAYFSNDHKLKLFRLFRNSSNRFLILNSYNKLFDSERGDEEIFSKPNWGKLNINNEERVSINFDNSEGYTILNIGLVNTSFTTLCNNMLSSLQFYNYSLVEIWVEEKYSKKISTIYHIRIKFFEKLSTNQINSLSSDIDRYVQEYIKIRSIFDIVGPSMVGPSSSHTAGANRIGQIARKIINSATKKNESNNIKGIKVKLIGSFRDTGVGHNTPEAIIGGLCGYNTDDADMISKGMEIIKGESSKIPFSNFELDFKGLVEGNEKDDAKYKDEGNNNIVEIIVENDNNIVITGFSVGGGNVEIRYINGNRLTEFLDGKAKKKLEAKLFDLKSDSNFMIEPIYKDAAQDTKHFISEFNTFEEMVQIFGTYARSKDLINKICKIENKISGLTREEIIIGMNNYWTIMKESIIQSSQDDKLSRLGLTGDDSQKIMQGIKSGKVNFHNSIYVKSLQYSIGVNEINAKNGVIVACPTGGACGILPGVLKAWEETENDLGTEIKDEKIIEAMIIAGFFGMILFDDVPTAGADLGCQAEIGGGTAMTAAALVYLDDGTLKQMVHAFALALKNSMGLVCDPIGGLVELPCVKRNGIFSSVAISSAYLALTGVESKVPVDEVILAVKEVGEKMDDAYKETAKGGLAKTRYGKSVDVKIKKETEGLFSK